jgi:hypothetical protein
MNLLYNYGTHAYKEMTFGSKYGKVYRMDSTVSKSEFD